MPKGLDESLASVDKQNSDAVDPKRSEELAKKSTDSFPNKSMNPLAASKPDKPKPGITFAAQEKLPKLPIPDLESTCRKYLEALRPLQSAREHSDTKIAVQDFLHGDGPDLQEKLKKYAVGKTSYIEQFCASFAHSDAMILLC